MRCSWSPWVCLMLATGCATAQVPPEPSPLESRPMQLTAPPTLAFVHGPSTASAPALARWLSQQHDTVRLPVLVSLGVARSTVAGGQVLTGSSEPFPVALEDSALGISLADRARTACAGADQCALWLEGGWRPAGLFVTRVVRPLSPEERARPLFAQLEVPEGRLELAALLERLGSDAPLAEKREAALALRLSGLAAVPLLIASLEDERPFEVRDLTNRMNLPLGANPAPVMAPRTVGSRCEDLLHDIVTPAVESPPAGNFKVFSEEVLRIPDWRAFWAKRQGRSLAQIHAELAPLVREYWKAHGTTQPVP